MYEESWSQGIYKFFCIKNFYVTYMGPLPACINGTTCMPSALKGQKRYRIPWNWSCVSCHVGAGSLPVLLTTKLCVLF